MSAGGDGVRQPRPQTGDSTYDASFAGWERYPHIALAVSGGADSMAMMRLAHDWRERRRETVPPSTALTVLTVDHGLRTASTSEAAWVGAQAARLGLPHHTLVWQGNKPATGVQAAARRARYGLLSAFCHANDIPALAVAHTLDDQAETVLMRLARGSGADGLSAMAPLSRQNGIDLLRPLLDVSRAELEAALRGRGQDWIDDPSNQDAHYERVRIRRALKRSGELNLTARALGLTARRLARARDALEIATADFLGAALRVHAAGFGEMPLATLMDAPEEIALRALARATQCFGGLSARARLARLEALHGALRQGTRHATLAGCVFAVRRGQLLIVREYGRIAPNATAAGPHGEPLLWDGRFTVVPPPDCPPALGLRALGPDGLAAIKAAQGSLGAVPRLAALALPSLWQSGRLCFTPGAIWPNRPPSGWLTEASAEFASGPAPFARG